MKLNFPLRIGSILRVIIAAVAAISALGYFILGSGHTYINAAGLCLIEGLAAILYLSSGRFSTKYPAAILVTVMLIIFVQARLCVLIFIPDSLLGSSSIASRHFNGTLAYIIAGTIACYLGCGAGHLRIYRARTQAAWQPSNDSSLIFFFLAFVFSVIASLWVYFSFGYAGSTGSGTHLGFFQRYVARLLVPAPWLILFLAAYMLHPMRGTRTRLLIGALAIYFVSFMLQGSRSGIFEIVTLILAAKVLLEGNFTLMIKARHLLILLIAPPVALLAYQIPTQLREHWYDSKFSLIQHFSHILSGDASPLVDESTISNISYRLSFIEPTMFPIYATDLGMNDVSDLVNVKTTALSSINRLIPGKPLGDILFSEYAYGYMYNAWEGVLVYADDGRVDYVGYEWSMFGISYQLFGFYGGCVFIFIATALIVKLIKALAASGSIYGVSFGLYFMTIFIIWIRNLGLDNLVDRTAHGFAVLVIYAAIYWVVTRGAKAGFGRAYTNPS